MKFSIADECNNQKSLRVRLSQLWQQCAAGLAIPPPLSTDYVRPEYAAFMKTEIMRYTPAYARKRVYIHNLEILEKALARSNVMLGFLHHGSWLLIGGVIRHILGLPYTVIASRRNLDVMTEADFRYWSRAQEFIAEYYGDDLLFSDQSPLRIMRWSKKRPSVLGVSFDVREYDQGYKECEVPFCGKTLLVQTGPAKLARMAKLIIVPTGIHYLPDQKKHELHFFPPVDPKTTDCTISVTRAVFSSLEEHYADYEKQSFFDLLDIFSRPHVPCPE